MSIQTDCLQINRMRAKTCEELIRDSGKDNIFLSPACILPTAGGY